ncbi:MAG: 3-hydroxyanthranilate 3,4-dioxygenase, partial [Gammaproteobacteria bacterium]
GEMFLLPAEVPHSPQRFPDTVGLVIERRRRPEEKDGFMWFCEKCNHKLYEEYLHVSDIVAQLPPVFDRFYGDRMNLRCDRCGHEMPGREQLD